jgi:hypothetical protein
MSRRCPIGLTLSQAFLAIAEAMESAVFYLQSDNETVSEYYKNV